MIYFVIAKKQKADKMRQAGLKEVEESPQFFKNQNQDLRRKNLRISTLEKSKTQQNGTLITIKTVDNSLKYPQSTKKILVFQKRINNIYFLLFCLFKKITPETL